MRYQYYKQTALEEFIAERYISHSLLKPDDLDIHQIADCFKIEIYYDNCIPCSDNEKRVIFLNLKYKERELREIFFHELCHVLRHVGDQRRLPSLFKEGQEVEADQFKFYAAIPFHIINNLPVPQQRGQAIKYIADTFQVTKEFAEKRLDQLERRELQGKIDAAFVNLQKSFQGVHEVSSEGIQLFAFYDSMADIPGPSQLVIEANSEAMDSQITFFFNPEGPFQRLEVENYYGYKCIRLSEQDLIYKKGRIGVNFAVLNLKYGRAAQRFVIQMKDVELLSSF
ncbi:ImmA/IrrE family metallo-endopeptidase [Paenibacillus sp. OAE614]|uniref:ImmA/IrrE family metallo-endopeptidase n=1 Tax=Paenibacillus sp. OAE614 TaxID=2663804 RepID=UPI0017891A77